MSNTVAPKTKRRRKRKINAKSNKVTKRFCQECTATSCCTDTSCCTATSCCRYLFENSIYDVDIDIIIWAKIFVKLDSVNARNTTVF